MQPDQQKNYWQTNPQDETPGDTYKPESDQDNLSNEPFEMYAPEADQEIQTNQEQPTNQPDNSVDAVSVHWAASEYISQEKNGLWYFIFAIVIAVFIVADIFLLKEFTFSILVIVMAIAIIVFAKRAPRMINYTLTGNQGLYIDEKLYHFSEFRAFGLLKDHGQHTIMLIPTKRFYPGVSVYFPEDAGEKIVDILGNRLPMEQLKLDVIDIIVQKIRL